MKLVLVAHDIRSCHNVGSLLRTADGVGVDHVFLTGYTPYPPKPDDDRLPHLRQKIGRQIHKTALGAEDTVAWSQSVAVTPVLQRLKADGYLLAALEQTSTATLLPDFRSDQDIALLLGREVEGIEPQLLELMDVTLAIPMAGKKESFNVVQAAAMALYHCRYMAE